MTPSGAHTFDAPVVVVGEEAACVLAVILARGNLRDGLSLRELLDDLGVDRDRQVATIEAQLAFLERSRAQRKFAGNAATRGNEAALASPRGSVDLVSIDEAAALLQRSPRRLRQLAAAGDIPGERTVRGWRFERAAVVGYRDAMTAVS